MNCHKEHFARFAPLPGEDRNSFRTPLQALPFYLSHPENSEDQHLSFRAVFASLREFRQPLRARLR